MVVAALIFSATVEMAYRSPKITLIKEDYSKQGGITPQEYFGIYAVIPKKLPIKKYKWVYRANSTAFDRRLCDAYVKSHPDEYTICGRNKLTILSNGTPDQKLFKIAKQENTK